MIQRRLEGILDRELQQMLRHKGLSPSESHKEIQWSRSGCSEGVAQYRSRAVAVL